MSLAPRAGAPDVLGERAEVGVVVDVHRQASRASSPRRPSRRPSRGGSPRSRPSPRRAWTGPGRPMPTPSTRARSTPASAQHSLDQLGGGVEAVLGVVVVVHLAPAPRRGRCGEVGDGDARGGACRSRCRPRRPPRDRARSARAGGPRRWPGAAVGLAVDHEAVVVELGRRSSTPWSATARCGARCRRGWPRPSPSMH